ncbi:clathrin light chain-like [Episyrphus balteatus]|uniref:clathrin light chain-like n=1 Tax=Episyrphus balteatus TaxID=286459 RepID=UPI0024851995|nr:clathrin light chain-like [Episyrphus balteatus]
MDFGDDFEPKDVDPAAEFLAREQSALAGLEDEVLPPAQDTLLQDSVNTGGVGLESSTGSFEIIQNVGEPIDSGSQPAVARVEPEKIRKWREEQKTRLEEKDKEEERKKEELRLQAKVELEDWLRQTEESIAKTKAASRGAEKQDSFENGDIEPGTEWERIAKLCDFNPKSNKSGKDVSRMRSIYLHLKQNPIQTQKNI